MNFFSQNRCVDGFMAVYGARMTNDANFNLHPIDTSEQVHLTDMHSSTLNGLLQPSQIWCGDKLTALETKTDVDSSAIVSLRSMLALRFNASGSTPMHIRFRAFYKFLSGELLLTI